MDFSGFFRFFKNLKKLVFYNPSWQPWRQRYSSWRPSAAGTLSKQVSRDIVDDDDVHRCSKR